MQGQGVQQAEVKSVLSAERVLQHHMNADKYPNSHSQLLVSNVSWEKEEENRVMYRRWRLNTDLSQMVANGVKIGSAGTREVFEEYILRSAQCFECRHVFC